MVTKLDLFMKVKVLLSPQMEHSLSYGGEDLPLFRSLILGRLLLNSRSLEMPFNAAVSLQMENL